ncbi:MAG: hypothetical protein V4597_10655 [Pseudomonadota bacterium]
MLGPTVDVAIGLVFTYLLFALLLSTVLEAAAGWFKLRAARLEQAFAQLIEHPEAVAEERNLVARWLSGLGHGSGTAKVDKAASTATLTPEEAEAATERASGDLGPSFELRHEDIYHHPLVGGDGSSRPSYVSAANFSSALLQALRAGAGGQALAQVEESIDALPPGRLREALVTALNESEGDWDKLKAGIERWYDGAMDRLSGQYKRYTQLITFILGLILAVAFNVDTIRIVQRLYAEPTLRAAMVEQARKTVEAGAPEASKAGDLPAKAAAVERARDDLLRNAPVGWTAPPTLTLAQLASVPGWLVTALAGMLGAPFWFDLLKKLINIRNAGPRPESSTDLAKGKGK